MSLRFALPLALMTASSVGAQVPPSSSLTAAQTALVAKARANGATDLLTRPAPAGGVTLVGKLEGDQFALAFPAGWTGDGLVYAHGYSTPGTPVAVSDDPTAPGTGGGDDALCL